MVTEETMNLIDLAKMIDHSILHPTMTDEDLHHGCLLSRQYQVATACVKPYAVKQAFELLSGSDVGVCSVIGFPHGNNTTRIKVLETQLAIEDGASEIDMVVNIGKVIGKDWNFVSLEIKEINDATVSSGALLKVIFETDYLRDEEIIRLCEICSFHSVAFVKTSTGYGFIRQPNGYYSYQGATDHNLKLMREKCSPTVQIKAAGGVRTFDDLLRVREIGVSRIGATATQGILEEAKKRGFI
jgi:deoxyribose-phosphate aldolase